MYPEAMNEVNKNKRPQLEPNFVKLVADKLSNTPATCREYYIHPKVLSHHCENQRGLNSFENEYDTGAL